MDISSATKSPVLRASRSIQEFRVDHILEEEFVCNPGFMVAFAKQCKIDAASIQVQEVHHSISDSYGEADVVVLLKTHAPDRRVALLIEDKISAGAQPDQAECYHKRGKQGITDFLWDRYCTVIVAPDAYVGQKVDFDCSISLETIRDWLRVPGDKRAEFRCKKIDEAIAKKTASGVQIVCEVVTEFRRNYFTCLMDFNNRRGTDFTIREPKNTYYGDLWFRLHSRQLPSWARMRHKTRTSIRSRTGLIEISFPVTDFNKMGAMESLLAADMKMIANGKYRQHTAVEIEIPEIQERNLFDQERPKLEQALLAGERLWRLCLEHRDVIGKIVADAQQTKAV